MTTPPEQDAAAKLLEMGKATTGQRRSWYPSMVDVLAVGLAALLVFRPGPQLLNSDTGVHVRVGELILAGRALPATDPFSYVTAGQPIVLPSWLAEILFGVLHRWGGLTAIALWAALLTGLTYGLLALYMRRRGVEARLLVVATLWAAILGASWQSARPQLFTYLALVVLLFLLEGAPIYAVALLFAVWANLHAGFIYGLALLGIRAAAALLTRRAPGRPLALLGAAVAGTILNPYGPAIYLQIIRSIGSDGTLSLITEFRPPLLDPVYGPVFAGCVLVAAGALLAARRRLSLETGLVLLSFLALALLSARNVPILGLVAAPLIAVHLSRSGRHVRAPFGRVAAKEPRTRPGVWALPALLVLGLVAPAAGFNAQAYPVEALPAVRSAVGHGFEEFAWSGFLAYHDVPTYLSPLKFDTRSLETYLHTINADAGWAAELDRRAVQWALLPPAAPLAKALRQAGWAVQHQDSTAVLLVRP